MSFYNKIKEITDRDQRYHHDVYEFVMQALWFTQKKLKNNGHVTGRQLLEGIKDFAMEQYGPMAKTVIKHWGVHKTGDFGEIVFNMIDSGLMGKTEEDSRQDFNNIYDFEEAFNVFKIKVNKTRRKNLLKNEKKNLLS